jgi:hypothetical protein
MLCWGTAVNQEEIVFSFGSSLAIALAFFRISVGPDEDFR